MFLKTFNSGTLFIKVLDSSFQTFPKFKSKSLWPCNTAASSLVTSPFLAQSSISDEVTFIGDIKAVLFSSFFCLLDCRPPFFVGEDSLSLDGEIPLLLGDFLPECPNLYCYSIVKLEIHGTQD